MGEKVKGKRFWENPSTYKG